MKKKLKRLFSLILCIICMLICSNTTTDDNFDKEKYPSLSVDEVKNSDTQATLELIQIAESSS